MGNEPVNLKTFGGVNFNWNQVKSAKVKTGQNGEKIYFIEFKTGVTAEYPIQKEGSMRSRELTMWQSIDYDTETVLKNLKGVTVKGSKQDDHIEAIGVTDSTIDVSGDNNDDHVDIVSEGKYDKDGNALSYSNSYDNKVILDEDDTATKLHRSIKRKGPGKKDTREIKIRNVEGPGIENRM